MSTDAGRSSPSLATDCKKILRRRAQAGLKLWVTTLAVIAGLATGSLVVAGESALKPIVIVLSWDGMRHDYDSRGHFPGLARMATQGVKAQRLRAVVPSNTFPGHVSMATGTYPDRHGIVDNRFFDRERGLYSYSSDADWLQAEPLWIAAERQGIPAATYFWVGSESAWHGQRTRYRIAPFDGERSEVLKVEQILAWLELPEETRPRLIMSYWAGADSIGHNFGPNSDRLIKQIAQQDRSLVRLLAGIDAGKLWPRTTLLLVSDHGMTLSGEYLNLAGALAAAGIRARVFGGAVAQVYVNDPAQIAAAGEVVRSFPQAIVYAGAKLPAELRLRHPTRTGDWVAIVQPPYTFSGPALGRLLGRESGSHGYDPALPDMGGVFYALGRGVGKDLQLGEVRQIDLAATVSRLLGIDPPLHSEGVPIW